MPPANTFTSWQALPPFGIGVPGAPVQYGGGGTPQPYFRSEMDALISMYRAVPESNFPDGYLGTLQTRRGDRLLNAIKSRENERSYQRGVHKGEKIDPGDYFWPPNLTPDAGLRKEAKGEKWAPVGQPVEVMAHQGKLFIARGYDIENTDQRGRLDHLMPSAR